MSRRWILTWGIFLGLWVAACSRQGTPTTIVEGTPTPRATLVLPSQPASSTPTPTATASVTATPIQNQKSKIQNSPTPFPLNTEHWSLNTATPTPSPLACLASGGRIETGQLTTPLLPDPLDYRVYLPPCYDQQPTRAYPVLYLIHGQGSTDDQWDRLGADAAADALIAAGDVPPFIIVMPRDRLWSEPTEDKFGEAVISELVPWVDRHYRTLPERDHRAVGGLSRGGAWAVRLGLRHWELFGAFGAHSGFVFKSDVPSVKPWLDAIPAGDMPRIYLDIGDNDRPEIAQSASWLENLLTQRGIPHEWHLYPGYHEEKYWQAHVEDYLRWYAEGW